MCNFIQIILKVRDDFQKRENHFKSNHAETVKWMNLNLINLRMKTMFSS